MPGLVCSHNLFYLFSAADKPGFAIAVNNIHHITRYIYILLYCPLGRWGGVRRRCAAIEPRRSTAGGPSRRGGRRDEGSAPWWPGKKHSSDQQRRVHQPNCQRFSFILLFSFIEKRRILEEIQYFWIVWLKLLIMIFLPLFLPDEMTKKIRTTLSCTSGLTWRIRSSVYLS